MAAITFDSITKRFDDGTVAVDDLTLRIEDGECMVFVGPSGCGKTTALRMLAGLETPSQGEIYIGEEPITKIDPGERDIAMVFQNYALYPQMRVRQNMAFPLKMRGVPKREIAERIEEVAKLLSIETLLDRRPGELSGGQRQRVAIGRAICRNPQAFLLDEPLSNLDAKLRVMMRAELIKLRNRLGVTTLYVTHDQTEAMTIGERVSVIRDGSIRQVGAPNALYDDPADVFVAAFIGSPPMNFGAGELSHGSLRLGSDVFPIPASIQARLGERHLGPVLVGIRPEAISEVMSDASTEGVAEMEAIVEITEALGSETHAHLRFPGWEASSITERPPELTGTFAAKFGSRTRVRPDERVRVALDLNSCCLFDPTTELSLLAARDRSRLAAVVNQA